MFNIVAQLLLNAPSQANVNQAMAGINRSMQRGTRTALTFSDAVALKGENFAAYTVATAAVVKLTQVIGTATREAIRFESELAKIAQTVNLSTRFVKQSANEIRKIALLYGITTTKVAETIRVLAQAGISFGDAKKAAAELSKTNLLATFDNIGNTTDGLIAIMKQFNKSVNEANQSLGSINVVSKKYAVESSDLVDAVRIAGGTFATTGGKLEDLLAIFTTVRDTTRESAETIATGMRTIFSRLQRPKSIQYFRELGIELTDLKGNFVGNFEAIQKIQQGLSQAGISKGSVRFAEVIEELGGIRQSSRAIPMLTQAAKMTQIHAEAMKSASETAMDLAKAQETLEYRLDQTKQNFANLITEISETQGFRALTDLILGMTNGLIELGRALKGILPYLGILASFNIARSFGRLTRIGMRNVGPGTGSGALSLRGMLGFSRGGKVPGSGNGDTVPAMLEPGEFVLRKSAANAIGDSGLNEINGYAKGGKVSTSKLLRHTSIQGNKSLRNKVAQYPNWTGHDQLYLNYNIVPFNPATSRDKILRRQYAQAKLQGNAHAKGSAFEKMVAKRFRRKLTPNNDFLDFRDGEAKSDKNYGNTLTGKRYYTILTKTLNSKHGYERQFTPNIDTVSPQDYPITLYVDSLRNKKKKQIKSIFSPIKRANGGTSGSTDTVPAMLTPGEFVVNRESAQSFGYGNLKRINKYAKGGVVQKFADGGEVAGGFGMFDMAGFALQMGLAEVVISKIVGSMGTFRTAVEGASRTVRINQTLIEANTRVIERERDQRETVARNLLNDADQSDQRAASYRTRAYNLENNPSLKRVPNRMAQAQSLRSMADTEDFYASEDRRMAMRSFNTQTPREIRATRRLNTARGNTARGRLAGLGRNISGISVGDLGLTVLAAAVTATTVVFNKLTTALDEATKISIENGDVIGAEVNSRENSRAQATQTMALSGAGAGAAIGAGVGAFGGPAGIAIGAVIGGLIGLIAPLVDQFGSLRNILLNFVPVVGPLLVTLGTNLKGVTDSVLGWVGFETFAEAEEKAATQAKKDAAAIAKATEEEAAAKQNAAILTQVQTNLNRKLYKSFVELERAANKAVAIGDLGNALGDLTSGNFRTSSLSAGLASGKGGSIQAAGALLGSPEAAKQAAKFSQAEKDIKKATEDFAANRINAKQFQDIGSVIADDLGLEIGDLTGVGGADATKQLLSSIQEGGKAVREELINTAKGFEDGFNKYLDVLDKSAEAQINYQQSVLDFGETQRNRRQELEGFRVSGSTVGDIRARRSSIQPIQAAGLRQSLVATSARQGQVGSIIARTEAAKAGGRDLNGAQAQQLIQLTGQFSLLQMATKSQISLIKQDIQVRQQLVNSLKEELELEKQRAGALKDVGMSLAFGSVDEQSEARRLVQMKTAVEEAFRGGGAGAAASSISGQAGSLAEAQQIFSLLPAEISQAIQQVGLFKAGGQIGGKTGADIQNVALTGFTQAGQALIGQIQMQFNELRASEEAIMQAEKDNLNLLKESALLFSQSLGNVTTFFTGFGNELKNIVATLQNASIQMTMAPANVVVTVNTPQGMEQMAQQMKQEMMREISARFLALEQGR